MALIAIHNWKNPVEQWLIDEREFDPEKHQRWGESDGKNEIQKDEAGQEEVFDLTKTAKPKR